MEYGAVLNKIAVNDRKFLNANFPTNHIFLGGLFVARIGYYFTLCLEIQDYYVM